MEEDRYTRITLRLPKDLHAKLDEVADSTSKSLNAEIVGRLEASFEANGGLLAADLVEELRRTQVLLNLNRAEAVVRAAQHRKEVVGVEYSHLKDTKADPTALAKAEADWQRAHAEFMLALNRYEVIEEVARLTEAASPETLPPTGMPPAQRNTPDANPLRVATKAKPKGHAKKRG